MGRFQCKVFLHYLSCKQVQISVHVAVGRLSDSLPRAQGAERRERLWLQVKQTKGR